MKKVNELNMFETIPLVYNVYVSDNIFTKKTGTIMKVQNGYLFFKDAEATPVLIPLKESIC